MFPSKQPYSCTHIQPVWPNPTNILRVPPPRHSHCLNSSPLLIEANFTWTSGMKKFSCLIYFYYLAPSSDIVYILFVTLSILWRHNNDVNVCYICYNLKSTEEPIRRKRFGLNFERNGVWCYCLLKTFLLYRYQGFIRLYTIYIYICWHSRIVVLFLKRYNTKMEWTQYRKGK